MKYIFANLKRFDVPTEWSGINRLAPIDAWADAIVRGVQSGLAAYEGQVRTAVFFPEAHLLAARKSLAGKAILSLGCQGVYREDLADRKNFGAFTTNLPAAAARALGCEWALVGHCEERGDLAELVGEEDGNRKVSQLLHRSVACAVKRGLAVLYCIGENAGQRDDWQDVLAAQLREGLAGIEGNIVVAYEPVWAIGPGKQPPGREYIRRVAAFVKEVTGGLPVVYGGGLKAGNAAMLASIPEIDGGLIALTRFSGEIGFYPDEFHEILQLYMNGGPAPGAPAAGEVGV